MSHKFHDTSHIYHQPLSQNQGMTYSIQTRCKFHLMLNSSYILLREVHYRLNKSCHRTRIFRRFHSGMLIQSNPHNKYSRQQHKGMHQQGKLNNLYQQRRNKTHTLHDMGGKRRSHSGIHLKDNQDSKYLGLRHKLVDQVRKLESL